MSSMLRISVLVVFSAPLLRYTHFDLPLETIDLSHEEIAESEIARLLEFVSASTTVKNLKLEESGIGDGAMLNFGKALSRNSSLVALNLGKNHVTRKGMESLLNGLSSDGKDCLKQLKGTQKRYLDLPVSLSG